MSTIHIRSIWISRGHDFLGHHGGPRGEHGLVPMQAVECHAGRGIVGDRYYGHKEDFKGQITFFSNEVAEDVRVRLGLETMEPGFFRRNVLIDGVDLNALVGKRFKIGEVEFGGSEECSPCYWMDEAIAPGAHRAMIGRGGLRCRILRGGKLACGESVLEILADESPCADE